MSEVFFVYVTCPSEEVAGTVGRAMVESRHAACANIIPAMKSIYWWNDTIETADETVLLLKTTKENWPVLRDSVAQVHPYEVPCIVALPVVDGHAPYLQWIAGETL